jgi:hypothetical protein
MHSGELLPLVQHVAFVDVHPLDRVLLLEGEITVVPGGVDINVGVDHPTPTNRMECMENCAVISRAL